MAGVSMNIDVFWNATLCGVIEIDRTGILEEPDAFVFREAAGCSDSLVCVCFMCLDL